MTFAQRALGQRAGSWLESGRMAKVKLSSPLRELAGGNGRIEVGAATVGQAIRAIEQSHPKLAGWVLDEQGRIRQHVKVFLNGEVAALDTKISEADLLQILPSISGGAVQTATRPEKVAAPADEEQAELLEVPFAPISREGDGLPLFRPG